MPSVSAPAVVSVAQEGLRRHSEAVWGAEWRHPAWDIVVAANHPTAPLPPLPPLHSTTVLPPLTTLPRSVIYWIASSLPVHYYPLTTLPSPLLDTHSLPLIPSTASLC